MSPAELPTKITAYIPAYNVGEFLGRCICSLLAQTLPPDEILVIDDGSRDNSANIAAAFRGITLIRHHRNRGLAAVRNTAIHAARNELVASIDADCIAHPSWLAELAKNMTDPKLAGVGGKLTEGVQDTLADRWRAIHLPQEWGNCPLRNPRFLYGCNNLFRKSAVLELGGYDERMWTNGEDTDLSARLREKGWDLLYDPFARATHLRHDTTRSILSTYWRWWRFGVNAYGGGITLRSMIGHALFVHFPYNFLEPAKKDFNASRWSLLGFDLLVLGYFPYRDFRLWLDVTLRRVGRNK
jgi:cellulose synthase/poly-beta-1,6-N-acetylglucosamine synthase-like glycosyltransferase